MSRRFMSFTFCMMAFILCMIIVYFSVIVYIKVLSNNSAKLGRSVNTIEAMSENLEEPEAEEVKTNEEISRPEQKKILPVCVVEEHHEVIPYWFGAANLGLLSTRTGNTLMHIDGHSDLVVPAISSDFPLFHYPSFWQLPYLITKNDQFIAAAAAARLVSDLVWVMPNWAAKIPVLKSVGFIDYMAFNVSLGINTKLGKTAGTDADPHQRKQILCYCVEAHEKSDGRMDMWSQKRCFRDVLTSIDSLMSNDDCRVEQHARMDILTEDRMLKEILPGGTLQHLGKTGGFILDIDEDYFGTEASVMPLYAVGLSEDVIQPISRTVEKIFCGTSTDQELAADFIFQKMIKFIIENRQLCAPSKNAKGNDLDDSCLQLMEKTQSSLSFHRSENSKRLTYDDVSCSKGEKEEVERRRRHYKQLVKLLVAMSDEQLRTFAEIGLCLSDTPGVNFNAAAINFKLCDGKNRPGSQAAGVIFHVPGEEEMKIRVQQLVKMLQTMKATPELVTVCRSMRDGYTPRSLWRQIESSVLHALQNRYGGPRTTVKVNYDPDLMGGSNGWPGRWDK